MPSVSCTVCKPAPTSSECFGPVAVVVRYGEEKELFSALELMPSSLTATVLRGSAIRRFLRPVTWQGAPQELLPEELQDGPAGIPRRIDGVLELPR